MKKVLIELACAGCGKELSRKQALYETPWSGVYWCGDPDCTNYIMTNECIGEQLDFDDPCNHED